MSSCAEGKICSPHIKVSHVCLYCMCASHKLSSEREGGGPENNFARTHTGILFFNLFFYFLFFHHILSEIWFSSFFAKLMLMAPKITSKRFQSLEKNQLTHFVSRSLSMASWCKHLITVTKKIIKWSSHSANDDGYIWCTFCYSQNSLVYL